MTTLTNTQTKLSAYAQTLPSRDFLVGLRVYDMINEEYIYIQDIDGGIFASKDKRGGLGNYYSMRDLAIENSDK